MKMAGNFQVGNKDDISYCLEKYQLDQLTYVRVLKLFQRNTEGIQMEQFEDQYLEINGDTIPFNLKDLTDILNARGLVSRYTKASSAFKDEVMIYPSAKMLEKIHKLIPYKTLNDDSQEAAKLNGPVSAPSSNRLHVLLRKMDVPDFVRKDRKCQIYIIDMNKPKEIWFQIKGPDYSEKAVILEQEMSYFYTSPQSQAFKLTDVEKMTLRNPWIVAAPFQGKYYRALITSHAPRNGKVRVLFVDYGNADKVSAESLYRLKPEFCQIPVLALCGNEVTLPKRFQDELDIEVIGIIEEMDMFAEFQVKSLKGGWPVGPVPVKIYNQHGNSLLNILQFNNAFALI
eukprot:TRINITY_DN8568_c0_g1_i2.p1 TRINITY_DN8568_c0_g1~~TRINITY_DN8568_c0_g1_i2.p1  ORF type:complete len:342 (+),score=70.74 TRINITY_DN8568_c0_g1_i2:18-1043(+)